MRTTFKSNPDGSVSIAYDDCAVAGMRIKRTFFVVGRAVYERDDWGRDIQVCDKLDHGGYTLSCQDGDLISLIRLHYKRMRDQQRKIAAADEQR